jgi:hypothetical protein
MIHVENIHVLLRSFTGHTFVLQNTVPSVLIPCPSFRSHWVMDIGLSLEYIEILYVQEPKFRLITNNIT